MEKYMKYALILAAACAINLHIGIAKDKQGSNKMTNTDISTFVQESNTSKQVFTSNSLMELKRLTDPQLSPDGKWILFNHSTPVLGENRFQKDIYKASTDGKTLIQLTKDSKSNVEARWSPDGKKIAFVSNRNKGFQIFTMNPDGSDVQQITTCENGAGNIAWSPDGKFFSYTSDVKLHKTVEEQYPNCPKADVKMFEELPIRHWDEWSDEFRSHLFVIPSQGGAAVDIMPNEDHDTPLKPGGGAEQIAWSPDAKEIAYVCKKLHGRDFVATTNSSIYVYNFATKETKNITEKHLGYDLDPLYSPDGKFIAFISMEHNGFESDRRRLMLFNRASGTTAELSSKLDQWVGDKVWSPDSKALYFSAEDTGTVQIHKMMVADGSWEFITEGWYNHESGLNISADGTFLVYGRESITEPVNFYKMDLKSKAVLKLTNINDDVLAKYAKSNVAQKWITSRDGKKIHSWIVYPPNFDPKKKYPMLTYLQGGPQSMLSQKFHFRWNYYLMASHGYVVMLANRRGVPGFGQEWNNAISKDWSGNPMNDYIDCTDEMIKEPYIDKDRVCAGGASAGGYAAYWLASHHQKRFKAFVAHCGVFNLESMYGATEELWFPNWEYGGPYWEVKNKEFYEKNSPHKFVKSWDTPILIITGQRDYRVPYTQSLEAFTAAQAQGIPSKLLVFPDETHFVSKPQEFIIWDSEFFKFLDKYCKY